jgi:hypothetical protein
VLDDNLLLRLIERDDLSLQLITLCAILVGLRRAGSKNYSAREQEQEQPTGAAIFV